MIALASPTMFEQTVASIVMDRLIAVPPPAIVCVVLQDVEALVLVQRILQRTYAAMMIPARTKMSEEPSIALTAILAMLTTVEESISTSVMEQPCLIKTTCAFVTKTQQRPIGLIPTPLVPMAAHRFAKALLSRRMLQKVLVIVLRH